MTFSNVIRPFLYSSIIQKNYKNTIPNPKTPLKYNSYTISVIIFFDTIPYRQYFLNNIKQPEFRNSISFPNSSIKTSTTYNLYNSSNKK